MLVLHCPFCGRNQFEDCGIFATGVSEDGKTGCCRFHAETMDLARRVVERKDREPKPTEEEIIRSGVAFILDTSFGGE